MVKKNTEIKKVSGVGCTKVVTNEGDNKKYLSAALIIAQLPKIDYHDPEQVKTRIVEYFQIIMDTDNRPTVSGLGLALGLDRRRLWEIRSGEYETHTGMAELPRETRDLIIKAHELLENQWENYMMNNKMNPIAGIFFGTNNYGYRNRAELTYSDGKKEEDYNPDDIRRRYIEATECGVE